MPIVTGTLNAAEVLAGAHLDSKRGAAAAIIATIVTTRIAAAVAGTALVAGRWAAGLAHGGTWAGARAARHTLWGDHLRTDDPRLHVSGRLHHGRGSHNRCWSHNRRRCWGPDRTQDGGTRSAEGSGANGSADAAATTATGEAGDDHTDNQQQGNAFHSSGSSLPRPKVPGGAWELAGGRLDRAEGGCPPERTMGEGLGAGGSTRQTHLPAVGRDQRSVASGKRTSRRVRCKRNG